MRAHGFFIPFNWVEVGERWLHLLVSPLVCCTCQSYNAPSTPMAKKHPPSQTHTTCWIDVSGRRVLSKLHYACSWSIWMSTDQLHWLLHSINIQCAWACVLRTYSHHFLFCEHSRWQSFHVSSEKKASFYTQTLTGVKTFSVIIYAALTQVKWNGYQWMYNWKSESKVFNVLMGDRIEINISNYSLCISILQGPVQLECMFFFKLLLQYVGAEVTFEYLL